MNPKSDSTPAISLALVGVIFFLLAGGVVLVDAYLSQQDEIDRLEDERASMESVIISDSALGDVNQSATTSSSVIVDVAVPSYDTSRNTGEIVHGSMALLPTDALFLDISKSRYGTPFQQGLTRAHEAVSEAGYHPEDQGLLLSLDVPSRWSSVDGESASLVVALQYAEMNQTVDIDSGVTATGDLQRSGDIRAVGHVEQKIDAAAAEGFHTIVVPLNQGTDHPEITVVEVGNLSQAVSTLSEN